MAVSVFPAASSGGLQQYEQVFTSSGAWTKPEGVKTVEATVIGGSGGSVATAGCSGAGGYIKRIVDVSEDVSISVIVGSAGSSNSAGSGSSFKTLFANGSANATANNPTDQGDAIPDTSIEGSDFLLLSTNDYTIASGTGLDNQYPILFKYNNRHFAVSGVDQSGTGSFFWELNTTNKTTTQKILASNLSVSYGFNSRPVIGNGICVIANNSGNNTRIISFDGGDTWNSYNIWNLLGVAAAGTPRIIFEGGLFYVCGSNSNQPIYTTTNFSSVNSTISRGAPSRNSRAFGVAEGGQRILEIFDNGNTGAATLSQTSNGGSTWAIQNVSGSVVNPAFQHGVMENKIFWNPNFNEWFYVSWSNYNTGSVAQITFNSSAVSTSNTLAATGSFTISAYTTFPNWTSKVFANFFPDDQQFFVYQGSNNTTGNARVNKFAMNVYRAPDSNGRTFTDLPFPAWGWADRTLSSYGPNTSLHDKISEWLGTVIQKGNSSFGSNVASAGAGGPPFRVDGSYVAPGSGIDGLANGAAGAAFVTRSFGSGVNGNSVTGSNSAVPGNQGVVILRWWA